MAIQLERQPNNTNQPAGALVTVFGRELHVWMTNIEFVGGFQRAQGLHVDDQVEAYLSGAISSPKFTQKKRGENCMWTHVAASERICPAQLGPAPHNGVKSAPVQLA
jgi:hypothetical protein